MTDNFKESLTNEILTRAELISRVKELLLMFYLVFENDFSYTQKLIKHGEEYEIESLSELPKYFPAKNIRSLNCCIQELLMFLDTTLDEIFDEIVTVDYEND